MTQRPEIHPFAPLRLEPKLTATLRNGINVDIIPCTSYQVITFILSIEGGDCEAPMPRFADLLCMSLRRGTARYTAEQIAEALDHSGTSLSIVPFSHHISIDIVVNNQYFDEMMRLLKSIILQPTIPADTLEVDKEMLVAGIKHLRERTQEQAVNAVLAKYYGPNHPKGIIADENKVAQISRETLLQFHERHTSAAGMRITLAGNVGEHHIAALNDTIGDIAATPVPPLVIREPQFTGLGEVIKVPMLGKLQSSIAMRGAGPLRSHPDFIPLRIATMLLGGFFGSRLMQNVREKKGLTYGIRAQIVGFSDESPITIITDCNLERSATVLQEIRNEMELLCTTVATDDEMARLRQHICSELLKQVDTPFDRAAFLAKAARDNFGEGYIADHLQIINRITPEELRDVAARYLKPERFVTAMTTA